MRSGIVMNFLDAFFINRQKSALIFGGGEDECAEDLAFGLRIVDARHTYIAAQKIIGCRAVTSSRASQTCRTTTTDEVDVF